MDNICINCIGDKFIKRHIEQNGEAELCDKCGKEDKCINIRNLAEMVDEVYRQYYKPGEQIPKFYPDQDNPDWEMAGEDPNFIIQEMLEVDDNIADELFNILSSMESYDVEREGENPYYDMAFNYEEKPIYDYEFSELWKEFCKRIKHFSRFFDAEAINLLNEIFNDLVKYPHYGDLPPIRDFGNAENERYIYRARKSDEDQKIINLIRNPYKELGCPPHNKATGGRMNPVGISVFYGAFDRETCIAELRLPVGSKVISGKFEIIDKLIVLDLTVINNIYDYLSMFDPDYVRKLNKIRFLRKFEKELSKPVLPGDELLDYLPVQALIEYLGNYFKPQIDALIYPAVQMGGDKKNIVLFNHAAVVEIPNESKTEYKPQKYKIDWNEDYISIRDINENDRKDRENELGIELIDFEYSVMEYNFGKPRLRFISDSLKVHRIKSIQLQFDTLRIYY